MKMVVLVGLAQLGLCFLPLSTAHAGPDVFSSEFYEQNGIEPNGLETPAQLPVPFGEEINVIAGGFDNVGNVIFYTVNAAIFEDSFTGNAAGARAFDTAEEFVAWVFPLEAGDPLDPRFANRRQDNILDTHGGYFFNNPLGLWKLEFIQWLSDQEMVEAGFGGQMGDCAALRQDLLTMNGPSLDGNASPIFRTTGQVNMAKAQGCVSAISRMMAMMEEGPFRYLT